jgi:bifunctional non-homologous end joining protein LigD
LGRARRFDGCVRRASEPPARLLGTRRPGIALGAHTDEDGATIFLCAYKMGLEGIVSKKLSAPYRSGPSKDWLKIKNPDW